MQRHLIALGGGGFSMEPDNLALDQYVVNQTGQVRPRVCFLPTASGDADGYCLNFYKAFASLDCHPSTLSLFRPHTADLKGFLLEQHAIYVGGGNTKSMLALWREWGLDAILRAAWERGVVLAGLSAGAICWFEQGVTDSIPGQWGALPGLGFLPGSCNPHYDGEPERRPAYHQLLTAGRIAPGYGVDDGAALHFVDDRLARVVSSRPAAKAYWVAAQAGVVVERALETEYLQAADARR
jgi:dipeptidase E